MIKGVKKGISAVEYVSGEYCFAKEMEQIPQQYKEYNFIDLSFCDSMEDLLSAIMELELDELVLLGGRGTETLLQELVEKLAYIQKDRKVKIITKEVESNETSFVKYSKVRVKKAFHKMLTGCYQTSQDYQKAQQVFVPDKRYLDELQLCDAMDLNSEIFLPVSEYQEDSYDRWKETYYNQILFVGKDCIYANGIKENIPVSYLHYKEWKHSEKEKTCSYVLLDGKEDYDAIYKDLEYLNETGRIRNYQFYLVNECRWLGKCNLLAQRRFGIKAGKDIAICDRSTLFTFGEDSYKHYEKRVLAMEESKKARQCEHCAVHAWCTSCPSLSSEGRNDFCYTMQNYLEILDFIKLKNALLLLEQMSVSFSVENIRFASYNHRLLLPADARSRKPITGQRLLFEAEGSYYSFDMAQKELRRITKEQAYEMEIRLKGISNGI